jgi:hypothetical protein
MERIVLEEYNWQFYGIPKFYNRNFSHVFHIILVNKSFISNMDDDIKSKMQKKNGNMKLFMMMKVGKKPYKLMLME